MKRTVLAVTMIVLSLVCSSVSVAIATLQPTWAQPVNVTESMDGSEQPKVLVDEAGVHIFFLSSYEYPYEQRLYHKLRNKDGIWGDKQATPFVTYRYDAEIDSTGQLHALSAQGLYVSGTAAGVWSSPVPTGFGDEYGDERDLQIGPTGRAYVFTQHGSYSKQQDNGAWQMIPAPVTNAYNCRTGVDKNEVVHMACEANDSIIYVYSLPDQSWSQPYFLSNNELSVIDPMLTIDGAGRVHLLWRERTGRSRYELFHRSVLDGEWTATAAISSTFENSVAFSLQHTSDDMLHLLWQADGAKQYSIWSPETGWQTELLPQPEINDGRVPNSTSMLLAADGSAHFIWLYCNGCISTSKDQYEHTWRSAQGNWYGPTLMNVVAQPIGGGVSISPGEDNGIHVAWYIDGAIMYSSFETENIKPLYMPFVGS